MKELAFSEEEYRRRFDAVRNEADRRRIDYLVITEPAHFCWISGFNPSGLFYKSQLHVDVKTGDCAIVTHRMEENLGLSQSWVDRFLIWHHGTHDPIQMGIDHARQYVSGGKVVGMNLKSRYLPVRLSQARLPLKLRHCMELFGQHMKRAWLKLLQGSRLVGLIRPLGRRERTTVSASLLDRDLVLNLGIHRPQSEISVYSMAIPTHCNQG